MGELAKNDTFIIEKDFLESGHWEVTLKKYWTAGDTEAIDDEIFKMNLALGEDKKIHVEQITMRAGRIAIATQIIKGWNATRDGESVEITGKNIRKLPGDVFDWILETWEANQLKKV